MLNKIEKFMDTNHMISDGEHIIVGVSGGADSVCLLAVLKELAHKRKFELEALHVNHLLRGSEADSDAAYVGKLCEAWGITLHSVSCDVAGYAKEYHMSLEEAGRKLRYEELQRRAGRYEQAKIAVAHHQDDQAETVLYQMLRGSSLKGAGGIRPVRGNIIRPLLCVTRREIESYLQDRNIVFCVDKTNLEVDYARNKLRNVVIPYLTKEINKESVSNLNHLAGDLQEGYDYICAQAQKIFDEAVKKEHRISFLAERLMETPSVLRRETIRMALEELSGTSKNITRKHIEAVEELIFGQVSKRVTLPYCLTAFRDYELLVICKETEKDLQEFSYPFLDCVPEDFQWYTADFDGDWKKITNDYTKVLNYDTIKDTIEIRKRLPGDYITIDRSGKRKLLKTFFIDQKIPKEYRDRIWLVTSGSHVLWVVGYRISEVLKTTKATARVLVVTVRRKEHGV